jgi:ApaG protein
MSLQQSHPHGGASVAVTRGVRVHVRSFYLKEQSSPRDKKYRFAYAVRIVNESRETVRLEGRHWIITDATGHVEHVRGPGVVGQQPVLSPGDAFEYTSGCELPTARGTMEGSYQMVTLGGERFDATIAPFDLVLPYSLN